MNTNELKRLLSSYRLSADERASLRARIVATMESLPAVRNREELRLPLQGAHTWASLIKTSFTTPLSYRYLMTIVLLLALLAGGGTSLAAEQALPGDALYPVKVDIMEPLRATVAFSSAAKAKWEARVAERRLEEGEVLLANAGLSQDTKAAIEQRFLAASAKAKANIATVRERDAAAAAFIESDFETSLKTHRFIIERLDDDTSREESSSLRAIIDLQFSSGSSMDPGATSTAAKKRAENRGATAQRTLDDAFRFIAKNAAAFTATTSSTIASHLEAAQRAMASGTAAFSTGEYGAAFTFFADAHEAAQNAKATAAAARELWKKFEKRTDDRVERTQGSDGRDKEKTEDRDTDDDGERNRTASSTVSSSSSSRFEGRRTDDNERENEEEDEDDDRGRDRGRAATSTPSSTPPSSGTSSGQTVTRYSKTQVALHASAASCWTIVQGSVYDVTGWILQHPGGASAITSLCGIDGSAAFSGQHGGEARPAQELARFKIGILAP